MPPKRNSSTHLHTILAVGTTSGIISGIDVVKNADLLWAAPFTPVTDSDLVTKIVTDAGSFVTELSNAKVVASVDPTQTYTLYPYAMYSLAAQKPLLDDIYLGVEQLPRSDGQPLLFNANAQTMYAFAMKRGGMSVYDYSRQNAVQLSAEQSTRLISDLMYGMSRLHSSKIAHGDVHAHNAMIDFNDDECRAYWIDFGQVKVGADNIVLQTDVANMTDVIRMLLPKQQIAASRGRSRASDASRGRSRASSMTPSITDMHTILNTFRTDSLSKILMSTACDILTPRLELTQTTPGFTVASPKGTPMGTPISSGKRTASRRSPNSNTSTPAPKRTLAFGGTVKK